MQRNQFFPACFFVILSVFLLSANPAMAAPNILNYQGTLTVNSGNPVNGTKSMVFRVYDVAAGGTALWVSNSMTVNVQNGLFNVALEGFSGTLFSGDSRYLEVVVAGETQIPRKRLASVPYAIEATNGCPLGSIVPSVLTPQKFAIAAGDSGSFNIAGDKWVLADGRNVSGSKYSQLTGSVSVPDLRGMFLRGMNSGRNDGNQDPEGNNRQSGDFQQDSYKSHTHIQTTNNREFYDAPFNPGGLKFTSNDTSSPSDDPPHISGDEVTLPSGGTENRPKNVSVYYYIKIN